MQYSFIITPIIIWQHKRAKTALVDSLVKGHTCTTAKESVVPETEMEAMGINVMERVKLTVAIVSTDGMNTATLSCSLVMHELKQ